MTDLSVAADGSAEAGSSAVGGATGVAALVAAREARGMSAADVARRIRLHPRQLDAIERGDWAALPGRAFTRGAVRSYARLVEIDATQLLDDIGGLEAAETLRPSPSLEARLPRPGGFGFDPDRRSRRLPWAILGLAGVIGLALIFGREGERWPGYAWWPSAPQATPQTTPSSSPTGRPSGEGVSSTSAASEERAAGGVAPSSAVAPASGSGTEASPVTAVTPAESRVAAPNQPHTAADTAVAPPAGAAGSTAVPSVASGNPVPPAATPPGSPLTLRLVAQRQDAWVDIRDATGKPVFMGTLRPGTPLTVSGKGPLSYTIGNANQVEAQLQGRPLDLAASTVMPANVAKGVTP